MSNTANSIVPLTKVVPPASATGPYWDDFNEAKNFMRVLFRPGYAVQGRELTQLQTILQNQIERFGNHIFQEGSLVLGGGVTITSADTLTLAPQYANADIIVSNFANNYITKGNVKARVITTDSTDPLNPVLVIKYLTGQEFHNGDTLQIKNQLIYANVTQANTQIKGSIATSGDGIFYISGYFVKAPSQTILLEKASNAPSYRIGLQLQDGIVSSTADSSLLDPAMESTNFQAPGADRYQVNLVLSKRALDVDVDTSKFIELLRVSNGITQWVRKYATYSEIEKTLARRTYDEAGDYTVDPFVIELTSNTANANLVSMYLDPGKAYVKGFEFETIAPTLIDLPKARTTRAVTNYKLNTPIGNYVILTEVRAPSNSFFSVADLEVVDIHCVNDENVATWSSSAYNATKIGTTAIKQMTYDSSTDSTNPDSYRFRASLFNTNFFSLTSDTTFANANSVVYVQRMNLQSVGAATRTELTGPLIGTGQFKILYNVYAAPNEVSVYVGDGTAQTQAIMVANAKNVYYFGVDKPTESEILEHISLGGSRYVGPLGKPPALGIDDQSRFGICRVFQTYGTNNHYRIQVVGASPYEYNYSVRANNAETLIALANTQNATSNANLSGVTNAYAGIDIRVYAGPGTGYSGKIISYDGNSKIATVSPSFVNSLIPSTNSKYSMTFDATDMESFVMGGIAKKSYGDISLLSKIGGTSNGDAFIAESTYSPLLYPLPDSPVAANTIANQQYQYRKVYKNVSFTSSGTTSISPAIGESFEGSGVLSATQILTNYLVIAKNNFGSSNVTNGQIISFAQPGYSVNVSGGIAYFATGLTSSDIPNGFTADIVTTISINSGTESFQKSKVTVSGNTSFVTTASPDGNFGASNSSVFLNSGQVIITNPNQTSGLTDSLYVSDVKKLQGVYQFPTASVTPGTALSALKNITTNYRLNTGQTDSLYEHGSIILKPGYPAPKFPIVVVFDYFNIVNSPSDGLGYFSVDSYTDVPYEQIPVYTDVKTGDNIQLRDCIDFRPSRKNATNNQSTFSMTGARVPIPNQDFALSYQYYLPRIDKVTLSRDRNFNLVQGQPKEVPSEPNISGDDMLLYTLGIPAYTFSPKDINVQYHENRRYTMRDIGKIDQRVKSLEYYQTLSLLEKSATDQTILDSNGLERTKYGILVDPFTGHSVGDVNNDYYICAIDKVNQDLRPAFEQVNVPLVVGTTSGQIVKKDNVYFLSYVENQLLKQAYASKNVAINDYLIARFDGILTLSPTSDMWIDTVTLPDVIVNLTGANDAWLTISAALQAEGLTAFGTDWLSWQTLSQGIKITSNVSTMTVTTGEKLVDVSVIPFIRPMGVKFLALGLRSNRTFYPYFDGDKVAPYVARPNKVSVNFLNGANANSFIDLTSGDGEDMVSGSNSAGLVYVDVDANTLYLAPENGDKNMLFDNVLGTQFVSMLQTQVNDIAGRTFNYTFNKDGILNIFYNTYAALNTVYVYRSNGSVNISNTAPIFSANLNYTDGVRPNDADVDAYLSIPYTGANIPPSKYIGGLGKPPILGQTDQHRFGLLQLDFQQNQGNTITVVVGQEGPNVTGSGTPFQFAINLNRQNRELLRPGQILTGTESGAQCQITNIEHYSGEARAANTNRITLELTSSNTDSYYNGNTISIIRGVGMGQQRQITSYVGQAHVAFVSPNWDTIPTANSLYTIGPMNSLDAGELPGVFYIPSSNNIQFRTGDRIFKVTDAITGNDNDATSKASQVYHAFGLLEVQQADVISTRVPTLTVSSYVNTTVNQNIFTYNGSHNINEGNGNAQAGDPLAESFTINSTEYPNGVFITSVDLFFANKDEKLPVSVQLRPLDNGYPSSQIAYPHGTATLKPSQVTISSIPNAAWSNTNTRFTFAAPVYVAPGDHALVVMTDSIDYTVWVAGLGEVQVGGTTRISKQPYMGSLFKSQNGSTWNAIQDQDLMFRLNKATFSQGTGTVTLYNDHLNKPVNFDGFFFTYSDLQLTGTNIDYKYQSNIDGSFQSFIPGTTVEFTPSGGSYSQRTVGRVGGNYKAQMILSTTDTNISPQFDAERASLLTIRNVINAGGIPDSSLKLITGGSGYTSAPTVTISGGGGSGAAAYATLDPLLTGAVDDIHITSEGSGYFGTPTVTISGGGGSGATAEVISEESWRGGNMKVRYITRKVTLADGFDAGDLSVYLDAYKPAGTEVAVYYRILSSLDNTAWEQRPYIQMTQVGADVVSKTPDDFIEYNFVPSITTNMAAYSKDASQNQFTNFKYFAIKIVMTSNFSSVIPLVKNLRVTALPAS